MDGETFATTFLAAAAVWLLYTTAALVLIARHYLRGQAVYEVVRLLKQILARLSFSPSVTREDVAEIKALLAQANAALIKLLELLTPVFTPLPPTPEDVVALQAEVNPPSPRL